MDSFISTETSFDNGVRSPDMFWDDEDIKSAPVTDFWDFINDLEKYEKKKVKKMEDALRGLPPPPSLTTVNINVTEMLSKYYTFLPLFSDKSNTEDVQAKEDTPDNTEPLTGYLDDGAVLLDGNVTSICEKNESHNNSAKNRDNAENEAKTSSWPDILKCRFNDLHFNITCFSEKLESLSMKCSERFVSAETSSSLTVYSTITASPTSAEKRKEWRKILAAQKKSPCRRLTHLARRRTIPCNAATVREKVQSSMSKMILIDKNYFPHRKMLFSSDRKSPRVKLVPGRKTPGKKTPKNKTPRNKTPGKAHNSNSGSSSRKKAMRRLIMEPDNLSSSLTNKDMSRRALFISPSNKTTREVPSTSVPQAVRLKRALFVSPTSKPFTNDYLKRRHDTVDCTFDDSHGVMSKSLSYGCDSFGSSQIIQTVTRRSSEVLSQRNNVGLNDLHRRKLLWAISEALRAHGWRMDKPGFREKASLLARLTRRLLSLPPHAAKLAEPRISTSEFMLKLARQYVFAIIQGKTVEECFIEEQEKIDSVIKSKVTGYISPNTYEKMKAKTVISSVATLSLAKENMHDCVSDKSDQLKSAPKNVFQDKVVNVEINSKRSGTASQDKSVFYKSNSTPSFHEVAKMRARRQISFDIFDATKR